MRKNRRQMTKIVDMTSVAEGDTSALDRAGMVSSEKPFDIKSVGNPEDPSKFEVTDTKTNKVYTVNANALAGGDYHQIIKASDGTISDDEIRKAYGRAMALDWQDGWYSTPEMKKEAKTPGYKHIHLGGSDTEDIDYEIEQVKSKTVVLKKENVMAYLSERKGDINSIEQLDELLKEYIKVNSFSETLPHEFKVGDDDPKNKLLNVLLELRLLQMNLIENKVKSDDQQRLH